MSRRHFHKGQIQPDHMRRRFSDPDSGFKGSRSVQRRREELNLRERESERELLLDDGPDDPRAA